MPHCTLVFGTRPEAIKLAPLIWQLRARGATCYLLSTGQHEDLLDAVLEELRLTPDFRLPGPWPPDLPAALAHAVRGIAAALPASTQVVVVQGDTTSALAGALAAFYRGLPVAHVEAGLRTSRPDRPFPEEMHRRLLARLARWHFAPTEKARRNLLQEGIPQAQIFVTGNTVVDALRLLNKGDPRAHYLPADFLRNGRPKPYLLVTAHRREHAGHPLQEILLGVRAFLHAQPEARVLWWEHGNPLFREPVRRAFQNEPRVLLLPGMRYSHFLAFLRGARLVLTDSGGIQEEAPELGVPLIVVREETERVEGLHAGYAVCVPPERKRVQEALRVGWSSRKRALSLYGDGHAGERIADILLRLLGAGKIQ